jgi:hypothetical protein
MAARDDVRAQVLSEANSIQRSAGTSGEVRVEWFESLFEKELRKYAGFKTDLQANVRETEAALEDIRVGLDPRCCLAVAGPLTLGFTTGSERGLSQLSPDVANHQVSREGTSKL